MKRKRSATAPSSAKKDTPPSKTKSKKSAKSKKQTKNKEEPPYPPYLFYDHDEKQEMLRTEILGPLYTHSERHIIDYEQLDDRDLNGHIDEDVIEDAFKTKVVHYEPVLANDYKLVLPLDAFDPDVLDSLLSQTTWDSLSESEKVYLKRFLPAARDEATSVDTVKRLLSGENFAFGNDKHKFIDRLVSGYYHPLVTRERNKVLWLEKKNHQLDYCTQISGIHERLEHEKMEQIADLEEDVNILSRTADEEDEFDDEGLMVDEGEE